MKLVSGHLDHSVGLIEGDFLLPGLLHVVMLIQVLITVLHNAFARTRRVTRCKLCSSQLVEEILVVYVTLSFCVIPVAKVIRYVKVMALSLCSKQLYHYMDLELNLMSLFPSEPQRPAYFRNSIIILVFWITFVK